MPVLGPLANLREVVRDVVFLAAADALPEALDSSFVIPVLESELKFKTEHRDEMDTRELLEEFDELERLESASIRQRQFVSDASHPSTT